MDVSTFLSTLEAKKYITTDLTLIRSAITVAEPILSQRKRLSGETYFLHNLRVGEILSDLHADADVIAASLLHGSLVPESASERFGTNVVALLKGLDADIPCRAVN